MKIEFPSTVAVIARDAPVSGKLYVGALWLIASKTAGQNPRIELAWCG